MISLEGLLRKFRPHRDFECEGAFHLTHVPSLGPWAYLNIIFRAADAEVQRTIIDPLHLPGQVREFYHSYNGAHLFSDNMSVYGFLPRVFLYERENMRRSYPYNIINVNREYFDDLISSGIVVIGSYGYDRSEVFVDKSTGLVACSVGSDLSLLRATWPSFETWITEEIGRLSECFDNHGKRLVELEETLPGRN